MDAFDAEPSAADNFRAALAQKFQVFLDRSTVHLVPRWIAFAAAVGLYGLRVYLIQGWFIVTYGLGIFLLNNFIGFLSPQVDPESPRGRAGTGPRGARTVRPSETTDPAIARRDETPPQATGRCCRRRRATTSSRSRGACRSSSSGTPRRRASSPRFA